MAASDRLKLSPPASVTRRGSEPVRAVAGDLFDGASSAASVASSRAAVDLGRPARSATSVTPSGPSARAPSTAKARLMDWTLDTDPFLG